MDHWYVDAGETFDAGFQREFWNAIGYVRADRHFHLSRADFLGMSSIDLTRTPGVGPKRRQILERAQHLLRGGSAAASNDVRRDIVEVRRLLERIETSLEALLANPERSNSP